MVYYKGYKIFKKDGFFTVWLKYQRKNYRLRQFRYYDLIKKSINFDLKCKEYKKSMFVGGLHINKIDKIELNALFGKKD